MRSDPTSLRCARPWRAKLVKPGLVLLVAGLLPAMGSGATGMAQAQEDPSPAGRLEAVFGTMLGLDGLTTAAGGDSFPFPGLQTAGAYLALAGVSIWIRLPGPVTLWRAGCTWEASA